MKRNLISTLAVLAVAVLFALVVDAQPAKPQLTSTEPISSAIAVTPSNATTFQTICRALYVGSDGSVTVDVQNGGTNLAFVNAKGGSILPVRVKRVYATGTTSTGIICLY